LYFDLFLTLSGFASVVVRYDDLRKYGQRQSLSSDVYWRCAWFATADLFDQVLPRFNKKV